MSDINSAFRGAVDLSALANKVVKDKIDGPGQKSFKVPALSVALEEGIVRSVLEISSVVPVILSFYEPTDQAGVSLTQKLEDLVQKGDGAWFLAKVDMVAAVKVAEAFGVGSSATVAMILNGEPKPLFQGDQDEADLVVFLEKLVELAAKQGLSGKLVVSDEPSSTPEVQLTPAEQEALAAMDKGDFSQAVAIYEKELANNPGNETLIERLAQVKLVTRTVSGDLEQELSIDPKTVAEATRKADYLMAIGDAEASFALLLSFFDQTKEKQELTKHLLDLFNVVGKNHPATINARKLLATRMF